MHKELTTLTDTELLLMLELWKERWVQAVLCDTGCCGSPEDAEDMLHLLKAEVQRRCDMIAGRTQEQRGKQ